MPVRFYREEDLPRIYELEKEAHGNNAAPSRIIREAIEDGDCLVYDIDSPLGIMGFLIIEYDKRITDKDEYYTDDNQYPYVWDIAVANNTQNMGMGSELMNKFESEF